MIYLWFVVMIITWDFVKFLIRKLAKRVAKDFKEVCIIEMKRREQARNEHKPHRRKK